MRLRRRGTVDRPTRHRDIRHLRRVIVVRHTLPHGTRHPIIRHPGTRLPRGRTRRLHELTQHLPPIRRPEVPAASQVAGDSRAEADIVLAVAVAIVLEVAAADTVLAAVGTVAADMAAGTANPTF